MKPLFLSTAVVFNSVIFSITRNLDNNDKDITRVRTEWQMSIETDNTIYALDNEQKLVGFFFLFLYFSQYLSIIESFVSMHIDTRFTRYMYYLLSCLVIHRTLSVTCSFNIRNIIRFVDRWDLLNNNKAITTIVPWPFLFHHFFFIFRILNLY